jgi:hypothetical protein
MKTVIVGVARDEERTGHLQEFLAACEALEKFHPEGLTYVFVEGDSVDRTFEVLSDWVKPRPGSIVEKVDSGLPPFGKSKSFARTVHLAELRNRALELALKSDPDEVLMVDLNYVWDPDLDLIGALRAAGSDISAAMTTSHEGPGKKPVFYDVWAFRTLDGKQLSMYFPFAPGLNGTALVQMSSVGSCYLISRSALGIQYDGDQDCEHVGFCADARKKGLTITVSPAVWVRKCAVRGFAKTSTQALREVEQLVADGYRRLLHREPDPSGLEEYVNLILMGQLGVPKFYATLRGSNEGQKKFGMRLPRQNKITYCMMGRDRLHEFEGTLEQSLEYVDAFVFVDSGSVDGTLRFLARLSEKYPDKVTVVSHKWEDKFSATRNVYLGHLAEKQYTGWVLVSDTDEHFPPETLERLRGLIAGSPLGGYDGVTFRAHDVFVDDDDRKITVSEVVSDFHKPLLFRFDPSLRYEGEPHETMVGCPIFWKETDLEYVHTRSRLKVLRRAAENFFISNSNRRNPKWAVFRGLCDAHGLSCYDDFRTLLERGALPEPIEAWMKAHATDDEDGGDSEIREMAQLYFEVLPARRATGKETRP